MTLDRRNGAHPNDFSREIRDDEHGGMIPLEWGCTVIDLDRLYAAVGPRLLFLALEGKVWAWYEQHGGSPIAIRALAELKTDHDPQRSWAVTQELARGYGCIGLRITRHRNGSIEADIRTPDGSTRAAQYASSRDFVEAEIYPLYRRFDFDIEGGVFATDIINEGDVDAPF